jgi:hypothetical protein
VNNILEVTSNHYSGLVAFLFGKRIKQRFLLMKRALSSSLYNEKLIKVGD